MRKRKLPEELRRVVKLHVILGIALLFFAVVLAKSAVAQLQGGRTVTGIVSVLGAVLFCAVGLALLGDLIKGLRRQRKENHPKQEVREHGSE